MHTHTDTHTIFMRTANSVHARALRRAPACPCVCVCVCVCVCACVCVCVCVSYLDTYLHPLVRAEIKRGIKVTTSHTRKPTTVTCRHCTCVTHAHTHRHTHTRDIPVPMCVCVCLCVCVCVCACVPHLKTIAGAPPSPAPCTDCMVLIDTPPCVTHTYAHIHTS